MRDIQKYDLAQSNPRRHKVTPFDVSSNQNFSFDDQLNYYSIKSAILKFPLQNISIPI